MTADHWSARSVRKLLERIVEACGGCPLCDGVSSHAPDCVLEWHLRQLRHETPEPGPWVDPGEGRLARATLTEVARRIPGPGHEGVGDIARGALERLDKLGEG